MKKFIKNFKFFWKALWSKGPCVYCGRNARNMSWAELTHEALPELENYLTKTS